MSVKVFLMLNSKILIDGGADSLIAISLLEAINVGPLQNATTSDMTPRLYYELVECEFPREMLQPPEDCNVNFSLSFTIQKMKMEAEERLKYYDVDKTMDEINEQTENMKQVQGALSNPIGAATDFDELVIFVGCRMNWNLNSRSWKELSWRNNFYNLQPKVRFKSRLKRIALLLASLGVKLGSLCREKNHLLIVCRDLHFHVLL
ncbi:hypothetical protein MKW98_012731 [Papaver atlanticum]|uniref:Uncharacterized protein n=1 Tax=Papaver atlanticum TaxID=357466 RepID=A0AAD4XJF8_9MAGN|nr:hypothetical protein MKW98_012731 [Papaver atlanticum]